MKINPVFLAGALLAVVLAGCSESREAKEKRSRDILVSTVLGLGYLEENSLEAAETEFLRLIELAPGESVGYTNLGLVYLRMGRLEEAEAQLLKAIEIDRDLPDSRLMLAKVYELNQQQEESVKELSKILKTDPDHVKALYQLIDQYSAESAERGEFLQKLTSKLPGNIVPKLQLTEYFLRTGNSDQALRILEELPKIFPEFPEESIQYYESTTDLLRAGNATEALISFMMFYNYMKTSIVYQSGFSELEGPSENLDGFPVISFDPMLLSGEVGAESSILEVMKFVDISSSIGLGISEGYSTLVVSDFYGDGDYDLYLGNSAQSQGSKLFRNDFGFYEDITTSSGLSHSGEETATAFGDMDNDGFLDLFVGMAGSNVIYKNNGDGSFENMTDRMPVLRQTETNQAVFFDMDHEGDVDLVVAGPEQNMIFRNNGDGSFMDHTDRSGIVSQGVGSSDICFGDFDGDGTTDFAVANRVGNNLIYRNLRQGRYEDIVTGNETSIGANAKTITAGDYNNDGYLDLLLINSEGEPELYRNERNSQFEKDEKAGQSIALKNATTHDAIFLDFDNDGLQDIIVAGESQDLKSRGVQLFHNTGSGVFEETSNLLPDDLNARQIVAADHDDDGDLDLFVLNENGVRVLRNEGGNTNHYLKIKLVGLRTGNSKNNYFGIGSKIEVRAGDLYQMKIVNEPITYFGLGSRQIAEVVRIQWTNGVPQNIYFPEGDATMLEKQLLKGSCPFLYTWNGEEYVFAKDILWRSALGMPLGIMGEATALAFPDAAQEYVKIPGEILQPKDGSYSLQVTSELWETIYFDKLELIAVDHPASFEIYVNENFTPPPYPEHRIYKVRNRIIPESVKTGSGKDLTELISEKDNKYITDFDLEKFQGVTEVTDLELYPGEKIDTRNLHLFLNGWIFPTDASINTAISQSDNIELLSPRLQVVNAEGSWQTVNEEIGFPMGKNKTVIIDLTNAFLTDNYRIRLQTNLQIYWDHIFFANVKPELTVRTSNLPLSSADLHFRGYSAMERKGGRYGPHWFDYYDVTTGQKWLDLTGLYTKFGDVRPLLTDADDMYVISNGGDEMTLTFDSENLPELPEGWKRDFLIYSEGWVKDGDLNTAVGSTVEPLPFHGMSKYPYDEAYESYPDDSLHRKYRKEYNTRLIDAQRYKRAILDF